MADASKLDWIPTQKRVLTVEGIRLSVRSYIVLASFGAFPIIDSSCNLLGSDTVKLPARYKKEEVLKQGG